MKLKQLARRIRQMWCGLWTGHDDRLQVDLDQRSMHAFCWSCGRVSRGWRDNDSKPPRLTYAGDPERHRLPPVTDAVFQAATAPKDDFLIEFVGTDEVRIYPLRCASVFIEPEQVTKKKEPVVDWRGNRKLH